jgi:iron-sulfur cluster repair protein YtfE (RIC family)
MILADAKRGLAAGDLPRASRRFSEFRTGLEHHIAAEEEVLFPVFKALTGATGGGPIQVRLEHPAIDQAARDSSTLDGLVCRLRPFLAPPDAGRFG